MLRVGLVLLYLALPTVAWIALVTVLRRGPVVAPTLAAVVPLVGALVVAWVGYPAAHVHALRAVNGSDLVRGLLAVLLLAGLLWLAGRPLPGCRWQPAEGGCSATADHTARVHSP